MQITMEISTLYAAASLGAFFISFSFISIKRQPDPRDDNLHWIWFPSRSPSRGSGGKIGGNML